MARRYKWDSPHQWLRDAIDAGTINANEALNALLDKVDCDTLQDIFQDEMDNDGYFDPECY